MTKSGGGGALLAILMLGAIGAGIWLWTSLNPRAAAIECLTDILGIGETRTYTIDGIDYETTLIALTATQANFSINGERTPALGQNEIYTLSSGISIQVLVFFTDSGQTGGVQFSFIEPGCTPPGPPTPAQRCGVCVGNQFESVSTAGMPADQTCQELGTTVNKDLYAWNQYTRCINNEPIATPQFFRPTVSRIWLKDLKKTYVSANYFGREERTRCVNNGQYQSDDCWTEIRESHLGKVPNDFITAEWTPGRKIDIMVEVDNSAADDFDEAQLSEQERLDLAAIAANITEFDWANGNWWGRFRWWFDKWAIWGFDATGPIDSDAQNRQLAGYRKRFVDAAPYLNVAIVEIGFYGKTAAAEAYSTDYGRQTYPDVRLKTDTVRRANACQGDEDMEGWIKHFAVILTPPVINEDGQPELWEYNTTERSHRFNGHQLGGAGRIQIMTSIKLPESDDKIASGTSNFDVEGKYYAHVAVFDSCSLPDRPTLIQTVKGLSVELSNPVPTPQVCCEVGTFWWPWTPPQYYKSSIAYCQDLNKTNPNNVNWQKGSGIAVARPVEDCPANVMQGEACYRCDPINIGNLLTYQTRKTGDCEKLNRNTNGDYQDLGYTTDYRKARRQCDEVLPPENRTQKIVTCMTCAGDKVETRGQCMRGTYPANISILNAYCPELKLTNCYACGPGGTTHLILENSGEPAAFKYGSTPQTACQEITTERGQALWEGRHAWTREEAVTGTACIDNPKDAVVAFINPANDSQFCLRRPGLTDDENCRRETFPRKKGIPISQIGRIDPMTGTELESRTWLRNPHNPVCLNRLGQAQCVNQSECLPAINTVLSEQKDNKKVYDALRPVVADRWDRVQSWFVDLFTDTNPVEDRVQEFGICVPRTRGLAGWFLALPWWQKTFLIGAVVVVLVLAAQAFFGKKRQGMPARR